MAYKIGQTFEYIKPRGIVHGPEIAPTWYALTVPPQKERATREYLKANGVHAFYPSEKRERQVRGKRIEREHPMISQHIYAKFKQPPQWDILKEKQRLITGVFSYHDRPIEIGSAIIRRLQGLTVRAQELRDARAALLEVRPGDKARITGGALQGFPVDVKTVRQGIVWFSFITGGKGSAPLSSVERIPSEEDVAALNQMLYEEENADLTALTGPGTSAQCLSA